jgi:Leucine-rich repeat (LRR) protein
MLTELPANFFIIFKNIKWLDLRNNQITNLPLKGLAQHEMLRYLLLENNLIKRLPVEIGLCFYNTFLINFLSN